MLRRKCGSTEGGAGSIWHVECDAMDGEGHFACLKNMGVSGLL